MFRALRPYVKSLVQAAVRRGKPVVFGDLSRADPVSKIFGGERGTSVDRYYIDSYLGGKRGLISGDALEVAEIPYLTKFASERVKKYILAPDQQLVRPDHGADGVVLGDLTLSKTLPEKSFDCFVCTQTFNFIYDVRSAISGAYHLLRPGGVLLGTVSGISQVSRYDMERWGDYWRFTPLSMKMLLGEAFGPTVNIEAFGNALAAQIGLQGIAVEDLPAPSVLDRRDNDYPVIIGFSATKR
jgi:SAM-dependent methyltransferase